MTKIAFFVALTSSVLSGQLLAQAPHSAALTWSWTAGTATTTGTAISGSTALTVTSGTGIVVGQVVTGAGIAPSTTVAAVNGTAVTLSQATIAALSSTSVTFTGAAETGFNLYRAVSGSPLGPPAAPLKVISDSTARAYVDISGTGNILLEGTTYCYAVSAFDAGGESTLSNTFCGTIPTSPPPPPPAPDNLSGTVK